MVSLSFFCYRDKKQITSVSELWVITPEMLIFNVEYRKCIYIKHWFIQP